MAPEEYDLVIIGAGSGGLTAAGFATQLGAKVALVEKHHIGGDCTWTGCVPSKALLKAAKVAHDVRTASHYGIATNAPVTNMAKVREYIRAAIQQVYRFETPEELRQKGVEVILGAARFLDPRTILVGDRTVRSKAFLLTTGAKPSIPPIAGLNEVPFVTYEQIFDNDRLPESMVVVGGGPIGMEITQAYQRLGAKVTLVADRLLPKEEPEVRELIQRIFEREGTRFVWGRAKSARQDGNAVVIETDNGEARGDLLLVASGRKPTVDGLGLESAGVSYSEKGIPVDDHLRTNVKHIYAAGDVLGGYQFTHFAGWQSFQAVRNALLPGTSSGFTDLVPWVTFTDPEVARVGPSEVRRCHEQIGPAALLLALSLLIAVVAWVVLRAWIFRETWLHYLWQNDSYVLHQEWFAVTLVCLIYFTVFLFVRWQLIAWPMRCELLGRINDLKLQLDLEPLDSPAKKAKIDAMTELLSGAARSLNQIGPLDRILWTRGQEVAAWSHVDYVECELAVMQPFGTVEASLETAERNLREIRAEDAGALADLVCTAN